MKGKVLALDSDGNDEYVDFWFNESEIKGFYITEDNKDDNSVNVVLSETFTLKATKVLRDYLTKRFEM